MKKIWFIMTGAMLFLGGYAKAQESTSIPDGIYQYQGENTDAQSFIKIQQEQDGLAFFFSEGTIDAMSQVSVDIKNDSTFLCRAHGGLYFYREKEKCLILPLIDIRGNDIDKKYCLASELEGD